MLLIDHPNQAMLAHFSVARGLLGAYNALIEPRHELRAIAELIHGAGFDQRLQHALVEQPQVHFFAELKDRSKAAQLFARRRDRLNRVAAYILHPPKPKPDAVVMAREV